MNSLPSASRARLRRSAERPERCILAGIDLRAASSAASVGPETVTAEESLAELKELARSAGAEVLGSALQIRDRPVPATLLGSGKVREIQAWAAEIDCDFVLFDHDLTPSQHRNLERQLEVSVLDRTQLILDIFAKHARTHEGRLQVELAQLDYLLPRLAGRGAAMSRLGGGIGTRGPGETQLEHDRRKIRRRIAKLRSDIAKVRSVRQLQRAKRTSVPIPTIALCGYTNAAKSTLFNALTSANVVSDQRMFATLDPTIRKLRLPSRRPALLSDTVGFIRDLPPALVQAFRATLEEVTEAALILHVVDVSADRRAAHQNQVNRILDTLGALEKPQLLVLNKCDMVEEDERRFAERRLTGASGAVCAVSAKTGEGLNRLRQAIEDGLGYRDLLVRRFRFPYSAGKGLALLHRRGQVLKRNDGDDGVEVLAEVTDRLARHLAEYCVSA